MPRAFLFKSQRLEYPSQSRGDEVFFMRIEKPGMESHMDSWGTGRKETSPANKSMGYTHISASGS